RIPLVGTNRVYGPFALPVAFPLYDRAFSQFWVGVDGYISFTDGAFAPPNTPLPNNANGVPENLLAPFWDTFTTNGWEIFYKADSARFVVQFQDALRQGDPNPKTFEIVLRRDGTILFQYLRIGAIGSNSATVGIQNAARDDGLQMAFNTPYL